MLVKCLSVWISKKIKIQIPVKTAEKGGVMLEKRIREMLQSHAVGNLVADIIMRQYYTVARFTEDDAIRNARLFLEKEILELTATGAVL